MCVFHVIITYHRVTLGTLVQRISIHVNHINTNTYTSTNIPVTLNMKMDMSRYIGTHVRIYG